MTTQTSTPVAQTTVLEDINPIAFAGKNTAVIDFSSLVVPSVFENVPQGVIDSQELEAWWDQTLSIEERDARRCAYFTRNNYIILPQRPGYGTGLTQFARRGDNRHLNMTTGDIYRFQTREVPVLDAKGNPTGRHGFVLDVYNAGRNGIEYSPALKLAEILQPNGEPFTNRADAVRRYHPWCTEYENRTEHAMWLATEGAKAHIAKRDAYLKQQGQDMASLLAKRAQLIADLNAIKVAGVGASTEEEHQKLSMDWLKTGADYKANEEAIKDLEAAF